MKTAFFLLLGLVAFVLIYAMIYDFIEYFRLK